MEDKAENHRSAAGKARWAGLTDEQRREKMRPVWEKRDKKNSEARLARYRAEALSARRLSPGVYAVYLTDLLEKLGLADSEDLGSRPGFTVTGDSVIISRYRPG